MERSTAARQLYESRLMHTEKEIANFEEARLVLDEANDPAALGDIFAAFDDDSAHFEVMMGLIHDAEGYDRDAYLRALFAATPSMLKNAREWATIAHERVLKNREWLQDYRKMLPDLPDDQQKAIKEILQQIAETTPKVKRQVQAILKKLG